MKNKITSLIAAAAVFTAGCASENKGRDTGAGIGAVAGAVVGGVIGHQTGKRNEGALIGAALGGTIGGVAGKRMDKQKKELEKIAETKRTEQGLVTKLKSDILFDTGKSNLKPAAQTNLQQMAAVRSALVTNGMPDSTISVVGMGPADPIGDNKTPDGRMKNRRVEIEVTVDESKIPKQENQ